MKSYKLILIILIIFLKTGNVLSDTNIFNVNNIEVEKRGKISNELLANQAIKKGFKELIDKILLKEDSEKLQTLKSSKIKELVTYYQISNKSDSDSYSEKINFNISFDKDKMHNLFYEKNISYSEILDKELFILPILKKNNQIYIFNQNFFYENWNEFYNETLIEFILPLENIEIIQNVNSNKNNLFNLELNKIFIEYSGKNIALILIEDENSEEEKIYFKTTILGKKIIKNFKIKRSNLSREEFYKKMIKKTKNEIIDLVKSQNLIDIRSPSFLNAKIQINKKNNLVELRSRIKTIESIENIFIQKFNNESIFLKIKYLGKIDKLIKQLENKKIKLELVDNQWSINIT